MDPLQRTPLYEFHRRHGARLVPFAGWEMPVQYRGILEEHRAVREAAGLFDVSHMGEVRIAGPQAVHYLDFLVTNNVARLDVGQGLYTVMCYDDGTVVDDLIIYRTAETEYFAVINAGNIEKDVAWMVERSVGYDCAAVNVSAEHALLALQGPRALEIVEALGGASLRELPRFGLASAALAGIPVRAARTGYTGEDGFELFVAPAEAEALAEGLLRAGEPHGLQLAGLGARDSLRTEAGYPLYGHEISNRISPLEANLGWIVKFKKESPFYGRRALLKEREEGPKRTLLWFRLEGRRIAREGAEIFEGEHHVGRVTSGTLSPILNCAIGAALVLTDQLDPARLSVDIRGQRFPLEIVKPPLHQNS